MARLYLECNERVLVGAKVNVGVLCWDESNPNNDISAATGQCWVYPEVGGAIFSAQTCTVTGTTLIDVLKFWDTTGVTPGKYRVIVMVTLGSLVQPFQFSILVDPFPGIAM
jgi:hypothetical protein